MLNLITPYWTFVTHTSTCLDLLDTYFDDGPKRPNGDFLENLKVTEHLRISCFFGPCGNLRKFYRKFMENRRNSAKIAEKIQIPVIFQPCFAMFGQFSQIFGNSAEPCPWRMRAHAHELVMNQWHYYTSGDKSDQYFSRKSQQCCAVSVLGALSQ